MSTCKCYKRALGVGIWDGNDGLLHRLLRDVLVSGLITSF
jgi:hypothetical protein